MSPITNQDEQKAYLEAALKAHKALLEVAGLPADEIRLVVEGEVAELFGLPSGVEDRRVGEIAGIPVVDTAFLQGRPYGFLGGFAPHCCEEGKAELRSYGGGLWMHEFFGDEERPIRRCFFCGTELPSQFPDTEGPESLYEELAIFVDSDTPQKRRLIDQA